MTFKPGNKEAYVWFWLPDASEPVVCGKVAADTGTDTIHRFIYGRSYRDNAAAIPLLPHSLSVNGEEQMNRRGLHGVLRDAAPDAWGRRVLMYQRQMSVEQGEDELTEIDYLLGGGQRLGALHFQTTADNYEPKKQSVANIETMLKAAEAVENNTPLPPELEEALMHGTTIGGARPKAVIQKENGQLCIAKFSSTTDIHPVVRLEGLAMYLAKKAGIQTANNEWLKVLNKDVLVVERFDRMPKESKRKHFFSALTALDLDEMEARYASYPQLADYLRRYADDSVQTCQDLYRRMLFNIFIGNTDDHARNHALFWDGKSVQLTPAYDICIIPRASLHATQAMDVGEQGKQATLANALSSCKRFGVDTRQAKTMAAEIEEAIRNNWKEACDKYEIEDRLRERLWQKTVLSPAIRE